jgi:hypothetical protein
MARPALPDGQVEGRQHEQGDHRRGDQPADDHDRSDLRDLEARTPSEDHEGEQGRERDEGAEFASVMGR